MTQVNFKDVLWFAERASAAYQDEASIRRKFPNTIWVETLIDIDVQYFIEHEEESNCQVISIRGTANLPNAKEDAEYQQSKNDKLNIYVHKGFDRDTHRVYQSLLPRLDKSCKLRITGHSLGAAIATLLMMYLHQDGFEIEQSINFGQPKVTNRKGVDAFNFLPLIRVVDDKDVVPLVPPITLFDSVHGIYEHLGDEIILLDNQYFHYLGEHDAERKSIGSFWHNLGKESITDHFMDNYIKNINSKIAGAVEIPI